MKHQKIVIIGSGYVGATAAYALMLRNIASEIVTAGAAQNPGETRIDLAGRNMAIMRDIVDQLKPIREDAVISVKMAWNDYCLCR